MYNIRDDRYFGLAQVIWEVQLGNYDVMILIKTKISENIIVKTVLATTWCVLRQSPRLPEVRQGKWS